MRRIAFHVGWVAWVSALIAPMAFAAASTEPTAITPREPIVLFNGKDLSNFYTWIGASGPVEVNKKIQGREDPDRVFTVVDQIDGAPAIRISGQHWGGLITNGRYANYRLVAEYRWGNPTWGSRKNVLRDSGVLLHCQGEEGNYKTDFSGAWMRSIECQIIEGGTGDMILVGGHERGSTERISPSLKATVVPGKTHPLWSPEGKLMQFGRSTGTRVFWRDKDPDVKNVTGARGRNDVEKPVGEWNRLELVCNGGNVAFILNGMQVNGGQDSTFREGRILFQSEGAEIFFRRIELHPVK
ncbi:MAG: DUF1080 domain-containing protein [Opitutaceae bacterium]|nr:DUF1080 domain-containing protein [Opitutaceae bacterium]